MTHIDRGYKMKTLMLYRGQFKDESLFEEFLQAFGKDTTTDAIVVNAELMEEEEEMEKKSEK